MRAREIIKLKFFNKYLVPKSSFTRLEVYYFKINSVCELNN